MRTIVLANYEPKIRDYCNTIVVDGETGAQYIYDSDGVWTAYTSKQQEGATTGYVDSKISAATNSLKKYSDDGDASILAQAKEYADEKIPTESVSQTYVDNHDAATLQSAKDYTDARITAGIATTSYVDQQDAANLQTAKDYTDSSITTLNNMLTNLIEQSVQGFAVITMTDTDPGEGVPLAADHFIAVYQGEEENQ